MELTQQISGVQDELKLLKGEIKNILKELRGAVLAEENPFTRGVTPPTFHAVGRSDSDDADDSSDEPEAEKEAPEQPSASEDTASDGPTTPPPGALGGPPQPTSLHAGEPATASEEPSAAASKPQWDLLTIASLAAWSEDALTSLGPKRFQTVLELACFADLVSPDVKEVLSSMADLTPEQQANEKPMHINDCLVVLHQLEAILQGENVRRLPKRRRRRSRIR